MKILIVHNDYGRYSGEEAVVDRMAKMLEENGYVVRQLRMSTANSRGSIGGNIHGFLAGIYSPAGVKAMRKILKREKFALVNIHNLFPFISPAALFECKKAGIPVVMTVHNFRLMCPTGLFMRDSKPCELCLTKGNEWDCIRYNCEHFFLKSVGYAARNYVARITGAYSKCVDRFACITDFQRRKLIEAGFNKDKITVIPNSVVAPDSYLHIQGNYIGFCGRLSREKGIDMIFEVARRHPDIPFKIAGSVRENEKFDIPDNCELLGYIQGKTLADFYRNSRFFVMASRWYEGFPMNILEAAQYGKCVVAPNHGGFSEIIGMGDDAIGCLFTPGDADELDYAVTELWHDVAITQRLGAAAFEKLHCCYSTEVVAQQWRDLIDEITKSYSFKK